MPCPEPSRRPPAPVTVPGPAGRPGAPGGPARPPAAILVVECLGGFGDLLLALPLVHALGRSYPAARLTVVTPRPGDGLLAADPHVAEVVAADHADPLPAVRRALLRGRIDLAVSTTRHSGIPALLRTVARTVVDDLWADPPANELVDRRLLRRAARLGAIRPDLVDTDLRLYLDRDAVRQGRAAVTAALGGVCSGPPLLTLPSAGMTVKQWPAQSWQELARGWPGPVLTTAEGHSALGRSAVALPPLPLPVLAAACAELAERGGVVVGGDTGPLRLAAAAGAPVVALHGPTLAQRYGVSVPRAVHLQGLPGCAVRRPSSITEQECWWQGCPLDPTGSACLQALPVSLVRRTAATLAGVQPAIAG